MPNQKNQRNQGSDKKPGLQREGEMDKNNQNELVNDQTKGAGRRARSQNTGSSNEISGTDTDRSLGSAGARSRSGRSGG